MDSTTRRVVNDLFRALIAINPAFRQAWPSEVELKATKRQWMIAFEEAGIRSLEQLKSGLRRVRHSPSPFIPSPGQFIAMCKANPADVGAPEPRSAYLEAIKNSSKAYLAVGEEKRWSHPAVALAADTVSSMDLRSKPESIMFPLFQSSYLDICNEYHAGRNMNRIEGKESEQIESKSEITGL